MPNTSKLDRDTIRKYAEMGAAQAAAQHVNGLTHIFGAFPALRDNTLILLAGKTAGQTTMPAATNGNGDPNNAINSALIAQPPATTTVEGPASVGAVQRKRRVVSAAQKKKNSIRMKKYWAAQRKLRKQGKPSNAAAPAQT